MKKNSNRVRLTESQLQQVIKESVKKVLNEGKYRGLDGDIYDWDEMIDNLSSEFAIMTRKNPELLDEFKKWLFNTNFEQWKTFMFEFVRKIGITTSHYSYPYLPDSLE